MTSFTKAAAEDFFAFQALVVNDFLLSLKIQPGLGLRFQQIKRSYLWLLFMHYLVSVECKSYATFYYKL